MAADGPLLMSSTVAADEYWDGRLARSLTPHVVEVGGANDGVAWPSS